MSPLRSAAGAARHYNLRLPTEGLRQGHGASVPSPGFKGYRPCRRPLTRHNLVQTRPKQQPPGDGLKTAKTPPKSGRKPSKKPSPAGLRSDKSETPKGEETGPSTWTQNATQL